MDRKLADRLAGKYPKSPESTSTPLRKKRCENCAFYSPEDRECHKRQPGIVPTQAGIGGVWPPTRPEKFCGEHEAIPDGGLYETDTVPVLYRSDSV
jgi:hypothetical protein